MKKIMIHLMIFIYTNELFKNTDMDALDGGNFHASVFLPTGNIHFAISIYCSSNHHQTNRVCVFDPQDMRI